MTTVTVVTGDPRSGKVLVGSALAEYIAKEGAVVLVVEKHSVMQEPFAPPEDVILVSTTTRSEKWMIPWIKRYGEPLFHIHIKRLRP